MTNKVFRVDFLIVQVEVNRLRFNHTWRFVVERSLLEDIDSIFVVVEIIFYVWYVNWESFEN